MLSSQRLVMWGVRKKKNLLANTFLVFPNLLFSSGFLCVFPKVHALLRIGGMEDMYLEVCMIPWQHFSGWQAYQCENKNMATICFPVLLSVMLVIREIIMRSFWTPALAVSLTCLLEDRALSFTWVQVSTNFNKAVPNSKAWLSFPPWKALRYFYFEEQVKWKNWEDRGWWLWNCPLHTKSNG